MNDMSRQATRLDAIGGRYDPWLLGAAVTLASLGVVMVASSSIELEASPFYYLTRHLLFLGRHRAGVLGNAHRAQDHRTA